MPCGVSEEVAAIDWLQYKGDQQGGDVTFTKRQASMRVKQLLEGEHTCVVVITCGEPSEDGQMPVEMVYEGDSGLACYLLENAQEVLRQELEAREA